MHGRARPPARRDLLDEFTAALGAWSWEVALLQEVPPWWPAALAASLRAEERHVLTSRNALPALRRAIAVRWPDLIKSNGGGANAILVRGHHIAEHRSLRLRTLPERRRLHAVRLQPSDIWVGNLHAGGSEREAAKAAAAMLEWAEGAPCVLGGDFNLPAPSPPGFAAVAGEASDHVLASRAGADRPAEVLDRGALSDHAPLLVALSPRTA